MFGACFFANCSYEILGHKLSLGLATGEGALLALIYIGILVVQYGQFGLYGV